MNFSVEFSIPDPTDINSMKSKIVFPDEDERDEFDSEEEVDFGTRVLNFRKRELQRELREIKELEQARDQEEPDDDGSSEDDSDEDSDDFDRPSRNGRRGHR
jgi:hypothetical protein